MSKYTALAEFLTGYESDVWRVKFDALEKTLGVALPKSARAKAGWWDNDGASPQAKAWLEAGWRVEQADLAKGEAVFRRGAEPEPDPTARHVMTAAGAEYRKVKAVEAAKLAGVAAAAIGAVAGLGLLVRSLFARRR